MKVYFVPGLAADRRVFHRIELPEGFEMVHLEWITPLPQENLAQYALRLAEKIDRSQPFVLAGLSFGGMLVTEIAKQYPPVYTILLSSIPVSAQLPRYFKMAAVLRIHKILPVKILKYSAALKRLVTKEKAADKKLLWQIIRESDPALIRWSINAILQWHNEEAPAAFCHIHGTRDEVLPVRFTKPTHIIRGAGHLLVMSEAEKVNKILAEALCSLPCRSREVQQ